MTQVHPFRAIRYAARGDVSKRIAPPYDVLDARAKADLLQRDPKNIVGIDLPHVPAKELGPPEVYERAGSAFAAMLQDGTLERRDTPAIFAYRQTFTHEGRERQRSGMACCLDTLPFGPRPGGGILPHEQTFGGPKADRLALMRATRTQLSPIFGLHPDEDAGATRILQQVMASRPCDQSAQTADGVRHEVWTVEDSPTIDAYAAALSGEDVFVADGHHRYNTALNYLAELEATGDLPKDHPARKTMFVLVGMSDPGLIIGATHRVLGGMSGYSWRAFEDAAKDSLLITPTGEGPDTLEADMRALGEEIGDGCVLGLIDLKTRTCALATTIHADPLAQDFAEKPHAWRQLDVAIVQELVVEKICKARLNAGADVKWAFPHSMAEVLAIAQGLETGAGGGAGFAQLAVIVRPTPMEAVREISRAGVLMPQKSTFFYPKLATGLFMHALA